MRDERPVARGERQVTQPLLHHLEDLRIPEEPVRRLRQFGLGQPVPAFHRPDQRPGVPQLRAQLITIQARGVAGLPQHVCEQRQRRSIPARRAAICYTSLRESWPWRIFCLNTTPDRHTVTESVRSATMRNAPPAIESVTT